MVHITASLTCYRHPKYKAQRAPKSCQTCRAIYEMLYTLKYRMVSTDYLIRYKTPENTCGGLGETDSRRT